MVKDSALAILASEMADDASLPLRTNLVFGEGSPDAEIVFVGEAPGAEEDRQVRPFVGRSGQLLRKCLREAGFQEAEVYITNIVKRRPPENRDPLPAEIEAYRPYLARQLEILNPKVIVPLGRFSMNYFLPEAKITRDQGKVFRMKSGTLVYPMFHPAAALRNPEQMAEFTKGLQRLPAVLGKWTGPRG